MFISQGNVLLIQLILTAVELVKGSSFSDIDYKRPRDSSDLGVPSDFEPSPQLTSTLAMIAKGSGSGVGGILGSSPPEGPNTNSFGPYFTLYTPSYMQYPSQISRRSNTEIMDPETSFKEFKQLHQGTISGREMMTQGEMNWMAQVMERQQQQHQKEKLQSDENSNSLFGETVNFENNVSNAAFIDYSNNSAGQLLSSTGTSGTVSNTSPFVTEREYIPPSTTTTITLGSSKDMAGKIEIIGKESVVAASQVVAPQKQPFSYKEALEKNVDTSASSKSTLISSYRGVSGLRVKGHVVAKSRATLNEAIEIEEDRDSSADSSGNGKMKKSGSGERISRRKSSTSRRTSASITSTTSTTNTVETQSSKRDVSNQIRGQQQQMMRNYQTAHHTTSASAPNNRVPTSVTDICKVISKSVATSGSNPTEFPGAQSISGSNSNKTNLRLSEQEQQQAQEKQAIPEGAIPYTTWTSSFRMPTAFAPKYGVNAFKFPYSPRSDPVFLAQLEEFRKSLQTYEGKEILIDGSKFKDFQPKLNFFSASKANDKKVYTNSPLMKVFDAPPIRAWIPVRCDALGVDLRHEKNVDGHAGRGGVKAQVSVVYDAKRSTGDRKVLYIRKEYYDLEYFTNEYNLLQFANHQHIPKPLCVEYDPYPKIVMDYVPGERVHIAFFHLGQTFREDYPSDPNLQRQKMSDALSKVLAKILVTLRYIHSIGFIHTDLKPENIIYDLKSGRIAIIDFDLSVSAPYAFTGRGTEATVAPEVYGLLKGPVHFGIDWWAYGSTAAMMIATALAGLCYDNDSLVEETIKYVPFKYDRATNRYEMTPIPKYFSPVMRSFLYPFFNPDPSRRVFSEASAYHWIKSHPMFKCVENWHNYEHVNLGAYASLSPIQLGFMNFSNSPRLLKPVNRAAKLFSGLSNGFSQMLSVFGGGSTVAKEETSVVSKHEEEEDDEEEEEDEEDESVENENEQENNDIFVMDS